MAGTPFVIDDDEANGLSTNGREPENLDDDVVEIEAAEFGYVRELIRKQPVPPGHRIVSSVYAFGIKIEPGMAFELKDPPAPDDLHRDFVRIMYISKDTTVATSNSTDHITLHVLRLRKTKHVNLKWSAAELCILILAASGDNRPDFQRGQQRCTLNDIIPLPRKIVFTNLPYSAEQHDCRVPGRVQRRMWEEGTLMCRWKRIHMYTVQGANNVQIQENGVKITTEIFQQLSQDEADEGCGMPDAAKILNFLVRRTEKRDRFEQTTRQNRRALREGMERLSVHPSTPSRKRSAPGEREGCEKQSLPRNFPTRYKGSALTDLGLHLFDRRKTYCFGDHFCGIGGVSAAARKAGLQIIFGNDFAKWAAASYRANFREPETETFQMHCHEFLTSGTAYRMRYCHIIHFSPPCQPYSPNHTIEGKNDDRNRDSNLAIGELLRAHCPRFGTVEQTSGLKTHEQHLEYFKALQRQFTDAGYNVQLRIVNLAEHETPSQRKRLMVMACWYVQRSSAANDPADNLCSPGEILPEFPPPSRGEKHGLRPFMTLWESLQGISATDPWHTPEKMRETQRARPQNKTLAAWDETMHRIIDTSGPAFLHPSGRPFTLAEGLRMMRFPRNYRLAPGIPLTWGWRGIGNAVPGDFKTKVYSRMIEQLKKSDEKIKAFLMPIEIDIEKDVRLPSRKRAASRQAVPKAEAKENGGGWQTDAIELSDSDEDLPDIRLGRLAAPRQPHQALRNMSQNLGLGEAPVFPQRPARRDGIFSSLPARHRPRKDGHDARPVSRETNTFVPKPENELSNISTDSSETSHRPQKKPRTMDDAYGTSKASAWASTPKPQDRAPRPSWTSTVVDLTKD